MRTSFLDALESAKARLDIPTLWSIFGLQGNPSKSCKSPVRDEKNDSFSVYDSGRRFKCFATGAGGDQADFVALVLGLTAREGVAKLIELAGGAVAPAVVQSLPARNRDSEEAEKERKRQSWPAFEIPTTAELRAIAGARGFGVEGLRLAVDRGLLWCCDSVEGRAWVVADSTRRNAQARLVSGRAWKCLGGKKARTLPGSEAAWPVGLREASSFGASALVEGSSDFLAAFHLAWVAGTENEVAPVAMLGAANRIPDDALPLFAGKRVRIFPDNDVPGLGACSRWMGQLLAVGALVDFFDFFGLLTTSGETVKDLCDFVLLNVDSWERERTAVDAAFHFLQAERRVAA